MLRSIITPGVGPGLVATINVALLSLLSLLAALVWNGTADVHTAILCGLALGLLASVNYFVSTLNETQSARPDGASSSDGDESAEAAVQTTTTPTRSSARKLHKSTGITSSASNQAAERAAHTD